MKKCTGLFVGISVLGLLLSGCMSVGPDYEAPEVDVPDAWHSAATEGLKEGDASLQSWWLLFEDDVLNELITVASTNNLDLKTASARIEQAAALRGVSASQYWPSIVGGASASAIQTTQAQTPAGSSRQNEMYQAGLGMAWELDLWGRIRRSVESADASLQSQVENYRDMMVLLYAQIATEYISARTLQERIFLAENNFEAQKETLTLTENRFDAGLVPSLDVSQARLNLSRTQASIPPLKQSLLIAINRLSVLTGAMPYALLEQFEERKPIPHIAREAVAGLPAELLRQRPDIRRAERDLAAQNAKIGATKAELYPTLSLPGSLTLAADSSDLFSSGNVAYSFGPQLQWNIFTAGGIRNSVRAEEAGTKAALYEYEKTVLLALEEVEGAMASHANEQDRYSALEVAEGSAKKSVELVSELYKSGLTDFQNVLNMEQALLVQQDELATSYGQISINLVNVYKSLGGGWSPAEGE